MVKEFGKPSQGSSAAHEGGDGETRPALDDPLLELARIVHQNNQTGGTVTGNRVGSTDYFADLDDVVPGFSRNDQQSAGGEARGSRIEPSFGTQPVQPEEHEADTDAASLPDAQTGHETEEPYFADEQDAVSAYSSEYDTDAEAVGTVEWPSAPSVTETASGRGAPQINLSPEDLLGDSFDDAFFQPEPVAAEPVAVETAEPVRVAPAVAPEEDGIPDFMANASRSPSSETPSASFSPSQAFEDNLTAELEDELIGAFRQSFDPVTQTASATDEVNVQQPEDVVSDEPQQTISPLPVEPAPVVPPLEIPVSYQPEQSAPPIAPQTSYRAENDEESDPLDVLARMAASRGPAALAAARLSGQGTAKPEPAFAQTTQQPFVEKTVESAATQMPPQEEEFDSLFAELDPPKRETTAPYGSVSQSNYAESTQMPSYNDGRRFDAAPGLRRDVAEADDIDDMAWPAAAESVPHLEDDETPPPPEGYDLDAVAKAMQESDPSLDGSGVLPPHPRVQRAAIPVEETKSRKGLWAAAAVLGVAVIGGGAFMFLDGDGIEAPTGAPPIIAGIQGPLKVVPDAAQDEDADGAKLIYDRVGGAEDTSRERLVVQDTPKPAELPPAPENANGGELLVPGAPKRVRTVVVKPDGTIVPAAGSEPSTPRVISTVPVTVNPNGQVTPAPATPTNPEPVRTAAVDPNANQPTIVTTTPITTTNEVAPGSSETPIANGPVVTVLPKPKPEVPVQVARAPETIAPVQTQPRPTEPVRSSGPLDLSNPGPAPVQTQAPSTGGSIAAGAYVVQVTSQRSETAARDAYQGLQRRYPGVLGNVNAVIVRADLGDRGTFYRARIPAGSRAQAVNLCESLKSAGGDCFVRQN